MLPEEEGHPPEKKLELKSDEILARKFQSEFNSDEEAGYLFFCEVNNGRGSFTCESPSQGDVNKFDSC